LYFYSSTKNNAINAILELVLTRRLSSEVRTFSVKETLLCALNNIFSALCDTFWDG